VEDALLRYAQAQAVTWGAERFAAEFLRRDLEERWQEAAESHTTPYTPAAEPGPPEWLSGPVDAAVQDDVVGSDPGSLRLQRSKHLRHASVPRPPEPESEPVRERRGLRRRDRTAPEPGWTLSPAEIAGMSAAGRRLYGLDDPS
jgi:hypothetical protein